MRGVGTRQASIRRPICPLCGKRMKSAIEHYRIDHDIDDVAKFIAQIDAIQANKERQNSFNLFVEGLKAQMAQGRITGEDYRNAIKTWIDENER